VGGYIVSVASTVSAVGILAGVGYLRGISRRFRAFEDKQFSDELYLLAHEQRIAALEPRRSA